MDNDFFRTQHIKTQHPGKKVSCEIIHDSSQTQLAFFVKKQVSEGNGESPVAKIASISSSSSATQPEIEKQQQEKAFDGD